MLELIGIKKVYEIGKVGDQNYQTVEALKGVSIEFRETEFVSILGQSGCGKTTLLNIIGGLDHYTEGDLIINGVSTKKYQDKDWDNYRNHRIGFVFQSYNLIPHLNVVENVELALTLSGVNKEQRKELAIEALTKVGLKDKIYSKPNQLSGGQMQRVAIARAIVNNPDIILADEPTGALDTETSVQVMELLKEISKEKLIIMVTHNPDLAEKYSTRIVRLLDGRLLSDTSPFNSKDVPEKIFEEQKKEKTSMSFLTALSLSGKNLLTKKGRTALVSFAGSIGIIGISLILSLSTGFQNYVNDVQQNTLSTYPLTITPTSVDYTSIISALSGNNSSGEAEDPGKLVADEVMVNLFNSVIGGSTSNDLTSFKKYIETSNKFDEFTTKYSYNLDLNVYDDDKTLLNPMTVFTDLMQSIADKYNAYCLENGQASQDFSQLIYMVKNLDTGVFSEMLDDPELLRGQYDLVKGKWATNYDECVIVVNEDYTMKDYSLYALGLSRDPSLDEIASNMVRSFTDGIDYNLTVSPISYESVLNKEYKILLKTDYFRETEETFIGADNKTYPIFEDCSDSKSFIDAQLDNEDAGINLKVVGIIKEKANVSAHSITTPCAYTPGLIKEMIRKINDSSVIKTQNANRNIDVMTGIVFPENNKTIDEKREFIKGYFAALSDDDILKIAASMQGMPTTDANTTRNLIISFLGSADDATIEKLYNDLTRSSSYAQNMLNFGIVDEDSPAAIVFYCNSFEAKSRLKAAIDDYNNMVKADENLGEKYVITYSDQVELMMSSISTIIDAVSYVLVAFVSVSLIVSSIMIGIITYISVLERTKEIGVLRSIGASKKDIKHVFTAESLIIGFISGMLGIGITLLLNIPISLVIKHFTGIANVASLPIVGGIILVVLSCLLTFFAGLFPSNIASKKDPVISLRSE